MSGTSRAAATATLDGPAPAAADEAGRLACLHRYGVLDQPPQADLDAAVRLAAAVCAAPAAVLELVDRDRAWPAAAHGLPDDVLARGASLAGWAVSGERVLAADDLDAYGYVPSRALFRGTARSGACAPLRTGDGHVLGGLTVLDTVPRRWDRDTLDRLADVAAVTVGLLDLRRVGAALARASTRDPLTGLASRRTFDVALGAALRRADRGLGTPSVLLLGLGDIDDLRATFGAAAADAVVRESATRLLGVARGPDTVARTGPAELSVLLEHTGGPGAQGALSRMRTALVPPYVLDGAAVVVPVSLGAASHRPGDTAASLLARADAARFSDLLGGEDGSELSLRWHSP